MRDVVLSDNAVRVLERRYLARDEHGNLTEDPKGMFERVARAVAAADAHFDAAADVDATAEKFFDVMAGLEFMPNSPTLMNAGRPLGQLSACFVLPVDDSMEQIFDAVKYAALIHKSGGGTGFSFSRLRPAGAAVRSTGGVASGPISFMKVFNSATEAVKQGGTRRGANMGILRVDHPDIMSFITCKLDTSEITNFNISVALTEDFMRAVEADEQYSLIDPHEGRETGKLRAREVFDKIVEMAWLNGEPGIVFIDRMNRDNPVPALGAIESTNPCGEQPLLPYESCNLGSINLSRMVRVDERTGEKAIDYARLGEVVDLAVHFLDNVIEINQYPLEQIRDMTLKSRKVGLGVMGWADLLFELGVSYDSAQGVALADEVMGFIHDRAWAASRALAKVRGPFPEWQRSVFAGDEQPPRNATVTTIAPTGTISIFAGASSGVEPLFALAFVRNVMDNDALPEANAVFERELKARGLYTPELMRRVAEHGTVQGITELPEQLRRVYVTAHDISPEAHVRMQAAFQRHTDNAVSKTVNFTHDATRDDVRQAYMLAWKLGLKGITIYRDGSRDSQVLNIGKTEAPKAEPQPEVKPVPQIAPMPRPRPDMTMGITEKVKIGCGNLYVTVNYDEQGICEVFTNLGRAGGCPSQSEATSRLVSTALRAGMKPETLIEQLRGIRCHSTLRQKGLKVLSCPDAIGQVLEKVMRMRREQGLDGCHLPGSVGIDDKRVSQERTQDNAVDPDALCPECGNPMEHEGGCVICRKCGYSRCS